MTEIINGSIYGYFCSLLFNLFSLDIFAFPLKYVEGSFSVHIYGVTCTLNIKILIYLKKHRVLTSSQMYSKIGDPMSKNSYGSHCFPVRYHSLFISKCLYF